MRASVKAEKAGFPTASILCSGFALQGKAIGAGLSMPDLPMATIAGHVNLQSGDELRKNVTTALVDQIVKGLTEQPRKMKTAPEPRSKDIIFRGTFDEVNEFFYEKEWGDGLPIIPPTIDRIAEFLKYTDSPPDEIIGVLLPDNRKATVWSVAVNGVMAGCRPEYMPVLVAIVEAMSDSKFGQKHLGNTPGTETLITLNGPVIKELRFNYEQGALRVGFQANTSIGRFWRMYLRNVAGILPHKTDKGTFGGTWRVVLAENEDALAEIGWEPMSVDQGFKAGDNVVTINAITASDSLSMSAIGGAEAERMLDRLANRLVDTQLYLSSLSLRGPCVRPQVLMSPCIAKALATAGYSKGKVKQYLYEHAVFPAKRFEQMFPGYESFCEAVEKGRIPKRYCESNDPDRLVPLVWSPDDFMITVSGDPARDNCFLCAQNGFIGYPVSKKIQLPSDWSELLKQAKTAKAA